MPLNLIYIKVLNNKILSHLQNTNFIKTCAIFLLKLSDSPLFHTFHLDPLVFWVPDIKGQYQSF
jgi:hypothetical protein